MSSTTAAIQVTEFVRALALSWKHLYAYPPGHPTLVRSLEAVNKRLAELRGPAGEVLLGIASDGLLYGDVKIDSLAAQKFAQALYTRGVALIRLSGETNGRDIDAFLRLLAAGAPRDQPHAIWEDLTAAGVVNINLQPVNYGAIQVTDRLDEKEQREGSLWEAILRALMEGKTFTEEGRALEMSASSAEALTRMLNEYAARQINDDAPFDPDATFGVRMPAIGDAAFFSVLSETVGRYIDNAWGLKKQNSIQQALQLLGGLAGPLREAILRGVLRALASDETAGALLREFATELPGDEVLEALQYLSSVETLSTHAIGLLESLSAVETKHRPGADSQTLISDLVRTFGADDADRFNPEDHAAFLRAAAIHIPQIPPELLGSMEPLGSSADSVSRSSIMRQSSAMALELLEEPDAGDSHRVLLERLQSIFRSHLRSGEFEDSLEVAKELQHLAERGATPSLRQGAADSLAHLAAPEVIADLVSILPTLPPEKMDSVSRLISGLGPAARRNLLVTLAEENNRSRRRRLFDFIASLGAETVPEVVAFLSDSRWYVVRNMIILLRVMRDRTSLPELRKLARHADLRVKLEALKSLLALEPETSAPLLDALFENPDPKVVETAVTLVGSYGIREGAGALLRILQGNDVQGRRRALRVKALRALGDLADPAVLSDLQRFFTQSWLPWPSKEERYAAWQSLQKYPKDVREPLLERGLRARDARIRTICGDLAAR